MANRGWDSTAGGEAVPSTARQSGRTTGCSIADPFVKGSQLVAHDGGGDMGDPGDLFEVPGNQA